MIGNIGKSALVVAVVGVITISAYTVNLVSTSESMAEELELKKEKNDTLMPSGGIPFVLGCTTYEPVNVSDLPQEIRSEVSARFAAYAVSGAFKDHEDAYKIVLRNKQSKMYAFYNADGEYLRQETVKPVQVIALK